MTEAQLLADLATISGILSVSSTPMIAKAEDDKFETKMTVEVMWTGLSEANKKPIEYTQSVRYSVYKRGQVGLESAYYEDDEPVNPSNKDVSTAGTDLISYERIFNSVELRSRVLGSLIKTAIYLIGVGTPAASVLWAQKFIRTPASFLDAFMCEVANNGDVRSAGNQVTDVLLDYCINTAVPIVAAAFTVDVVINGGL
jgi:hypothetical protein